MSRDAGVLRHRAGLERLSKVLDQAPSADSHLDRARPAGNRLDLATVEATNLHAVSVLVAASALARAESRGCHRWRDIQPVSSGPPGRHTVLCVEEGRVRDGQSVRLMERQEVGA
jgi:aspartate oxidase